MSSIVLENSESLNMKQDLAQEYEAKDFIYYQYERPEMLPFIPVGVSKILDVGCSGGSFSARLKSERTVEVWGIEPNEKAASIAAQKLDKVICSTFHDGLNFSVNEFDCIVFNDVLEHFVDPYTALEVAKKFLKKDGSLIASIPNVRFFDNIWNLLIDGNWEYTEEGILDKTHLRFFTRKSMLSTFHAAGYSIQKIEGINPIGFKHPKKARVFKLLNLLLFGWIKDMRYQQFAIVAKLK